MAGTGTSFADDWAAVYANPAGLSRARSRSLTLGYVGAGFDVSLSRGNSPAESYPLDPARALIAGLTLPVPLPGVLRDRIAIGVALELPVDLIARHRVLRPEVPQFIVLANRVQSIALMGGLGVDVGHGIRLGAGAEASATLTGTLIVANDAFGDLGYRIDDRLVVNYAPIAGASWDAGPFRLGAVFRGTLTGSLDVAIEAHDLGIMLPVFNVSGAGQYDPWQVGLEGAFVRGGFTLALGATFKRWSEYPGPLRATTPNSPAPPPPGFSDTLVPRVGGEYRWDFGRSFVALRAGYFYEPTPVPPATGASNYLDNDRHVATAGLAIAGRTRGTTLTFELFAQGHVLAPRTDTKSADVAADNPGSPSLTHGGALFLLGATATVSL